MIDLRHEEVRTYHYANGDEHTVDDPLYLSVAADGSHEITCADRVGVIVPAGFKSITVLPRFGEPAFAGHPVPSEFVTEA